MIGIQKPTGKVRKVCLGISPLPLYHFPLVRFLSSSNVGPRIWTFFTFHSLQYTIAQSIYNHYSSLSGRPDIFQGLEHQKNQVQKNQLKVSLQKLKTSVWGYKQKSLFRCTYITYIVNDRSYSIAVHSMTCKIVSGRSHYGVKLQQQSSTSCLILCQKRF